MMFPRAPEPTIMSMGLNFSAAMDFSMAFRTSSVASVQISISFWRRSSSVMTPLRNWVSTFSASFSKRSRIAALSGGVRTSSMEIVSPDRVEKWKPRSFRLSRLWPTTALG